MRKNHSRFHSMLHFLGQLLILLGFIVLIPLIFTCLYWGKHGDGLMTIAAFALPSLVSFSLGFYLIRKFRFTDLDMTGSMLVCSISWLVFSAIGALPFVTALGSSYLNGYFEAMSGFTTTGITVYDHLIEMPRSILFWRSLTQWLGGIGILSFFLALAIRGGGEHHIYSAESHKITSDRPTPGLFYSVKILWAVYLFFTVVGAALLTIEGMPLFDSICHALTALSTGGFSPHDASIAQYAIEHHSNFRLIEYTLTAMMMLGGITFLIHWRVLCGDIKALWDSLEIRLWWLFVAVFTAVIMSDHFLRAHDIKAFEEVFRKSIFQVVSILTTTGFGTQDIGSSFFPVLSKQLFLVMMVIGGCVGSTGGGIKVMRIAILTKQMGRELFKTMVSSKASTGLVVNRRIIPNEEVDKVAALFFTWMAFIVIGGGITALLSDQGAFESLSGMFSAVGNIGPCYISVPDMINMDPVVKITYIIGMLAGRLEILPVLLLFTRKAWK